MKTFFPEGALFLTEENRKALSSLSGLEKAMEEGMVLEAKSYLCDRNFSLIFDFGGIKGVLPKEEVAVTETGESVRDIAVITRVGKPTAFVVDRIAETPTPTVYLSRKKAQERCLRDYLDHLEEGDVLEARVTHFEPFGAFCDIGLGIVSLLSIDCISVSRISHPSDRFRLGQKILCAVKGRDEVRLGKRGRISLTHKELLGTWMENAAEFEVGQTVVGIVRSIESYGIFIELTPNLAGLAEWRWDVKVGDGCSVYIKNIIPSKMKIKLVLIDTFPIASGERELHYFIREGNVKNFSFAPLLPPEGGEKSPTAG
ncbi:MAG: S1 RNA-binding domain-containing protein [Clostridia bacterium]|nr:S1 RNA-binding domain-containing protein [Clostridia bacterium]